MLIWKRKRNIPVSPECAEGETDVSYCQVNRRCFVDILEYVFLVLQFVLIVCLGFLNWHLKDMYLDVAIMVLLSCSVFFCIILGKKKVMLIFIFGMIHTSTFSYSPWTHYLIQGMNVSNVYHDVDKGDVYLVNFEDGSMATVIFDGKEWQCYGREYANKPACKHIISIIKKQVAVRNYP
jgi:hypothetical protein